MSEHYDPDIQAQKDYEAFNAETAMDLSKAKKRIHDLEAEVEQLQGLVDSLQNKWASRELSQQDSDALMAEIERLRGALREIATSKYCNYENTGSGSYGIGVTDGHRFCANIAKQALDHQEEG